MDARIEPHQFNLEAFYDRFGALGKAMQRELKPLLHPSAQRQIVECRPILLDARQ
jgi:hypothetical protein